MSPWINISESNEWFITGSQDMRTWLNHLNQLRWNKDNPKPRGHRPLNTGGVGNHFISVHLLSFSALFQFVLAGETTLKTVSTLKKDTTIKVRIFKSTFSNSHGSGRSLHSFILPWQFSLQTRKVVANTQGCCFAQDCLWMVTCLGIRRWEAELAILASCQLWCKLH